MRTLTQKLGIGLGVFALAGMSAMEAQAQQITVSQTMTPVAIKFASVAGNRQAMPNQVFVVGGRSGANSSGAVQVLTIAGGRATAAQQRAALQGELRDNGEAAACPSGVIVQLGGSEASNRGRVANEAIGVNGPRGTSFLTEPARFATGGLVESVGNRVFAISGDIGAQGATRVVEAFNCDAINLNADGANRGAVAGAPAIPRAPIPTAVARAASAPAGNRIFVAGGRPSLNAGPAINQIQVYDTQANTWSQGMTLRQARFGHAMARLSDSQIIVLGGSDGQQVLRSTEIIDTQSGQVTAGPDLPMGLFGATAVNVGPNQVIVVGGSQGMEDNAASVRTILEISGAASGAGAGDGVGAAPVAPTAPVTGPVAP